MGAVIAEFVRYMASNSNNLPRLKLMLANAGCYVVIYYLSKYLIKASKKGQLKPFSKGVNNLKKRLTHFDIKKLMKSLDYSSV